MKSVRISDVKSRNTLAGASGLYFGSIRRTSGAAAKNSTAPLASVLTATPVNCLNIGTDIGGIVGEYPADFRFDGVIQSVIFEQESAAANQLN